MSTDLDIRLERIGSRIYDDFRAGVISFEVCEASLVSLSQVADATELGIPEDDSDGPALADEVRNNLRDAPSWIQRTDE